jgi:hypothetical protein
MVLKLLATFMAIGRQFTRHLGITFLKGRMTEVLAPDIYSYSLTHFKLCVLFPNHAKRI